MASTNRAGLDFNPELVGTVGSELADTTMSLARQLRSDVVIRDAVDLEQAVMDRQRIGDAIKQVDEFFKPLTQAAYRMHGLLCDRRNDIRAPLEKVDQVLRTAIADFKRAADREREEQERERAEQQRRDDHEQAAAEAAALESSGQPELAASVLSEAIAAPLPVVTLPDVTKTVVGLKFRRYYRWRYANGPTDITKTPGPVVARTMALVPREFLVVDVKKITAYGNAMKEAAKIPGITFYFVDEPIR